MERWVLGFDGNVWVDVHDQVPKRYVHKTYDQAQQDKKDLTWLKEKATKMGALFIGKEDMSRYVDDSKRYCRVTQRLFLMWCEDCSLAQWVTGQYNNKCGFCQTACYIETKHIDIDCEALCQNPTASGVLQVVSPNAPEALRCVQCAVIALEKLDEMAVSPDWRPLYTIPEDYYAL